MYTLKQINAALLDLIAHTYNLDPTTIASSGITVTLLDATQAHLGDLTTNAAMVLARQVRQAPRVIAQTLSTRILEFAKTDSSPLHAIAAADIAGPGFINLKLTPATWSNLLKELTFNTAAYFQNEQNEQKNSYLLEFVSANPTGPLHLGHGRNAILGDVLRRVLDFCGHEVATEFYVNDAGSQMVKLGTSLHIRCQQALGQDILFPEDGYHGQYVIEMAHQCINEHGESVIRNDISFFTDYAHDKMLAEQKKDLADYRVEIGNWFSEKSLHKSGAIQAALDRLQENGFLFEDGGALWFKSTAFGDDKDRVIRKKDGELTYIAADIAYHAHKFDRDPKSFLVDIFGQDHHGYVNRLKGTLCALGYDADTRLIVLLQQLVSLKKDNLPVRMSKRAGTFIGLRDVLDTVGVDAARFFFLHKKAESHLELDVEVAMKQSQENPLFYLQYAYVRTVSLQAKALTAGITQLDSDEYAGLTFDEAERALITQAMNLTSTLNTIVHTQATHLLATYALDFAKAFHGFYTNHKIIDPAAATTSQRRLVLVTMVQRVLGLVHDLLGLTKREKM